MTTPRTVRTLLASAIDYAGMFPPSSLDMATSVANYATYRRADHGWMLGRFVVPAARLGDFAAAAASVLPRGAAPPWAVCAVAGAGAAQDLSAIDTFNRAHDGRSVAGRAVVELVEVKVSTAHDVRALDDVMPRGTRMVCEVVSAAGALAATLQAIKACDGIAKIRTGGVTADAVPSNDAVADLLLACHAARVPFKATAGLHHAVSGVHPLTYEADAPGVRMHGFLNLLLASALVAAAPRGPEPRLRAQVVSLLAETDAAAFAFDDEGIRWRDVHLTDAALAASRDQFGLSFGSCSFEEPLGDLRALNLAV